MSPARPALLAIVAHARTGALEHAWRLYREAGLDREHDDPTVLTVRGRLLKDQAVASRGEERRRLYLEAGEIAFFSRLRRTQFIYASVQPLGRHVAEPLARCGAAYESLSAARLIPTVSS